MGRGDCTRMRLIAVVTGCNTYDLLGSLPILVAKTSTLVFSSFFPRLPTSQSRVPRPTVLARARRNVAL